MKRTQPIVLSACCLLLMTAGIASAQRSRDEDVKAPKVQRALQALEEAKQNLTAAQQTMPSRYEEELRRASDATTNAIQECRSAMKDANADRAVETGDAQQTNRPLRAADRALARAVEELSASDSDYGGHRKKALEYAQTAASRVTELAQIERDRASDDTASDRRRDRDSDRTDRPTSDDRAAGLPTAVRRTIRQNVPDLEVREVKREGEGGGQDGIVYKIEGTSERDGKVEMRVAADGELLKLDRKDR